MSEPQPGGREAGLSERYDVVVGGAGVAGLAAANALARTGRSVLLLEKQRSIAEPYKGEFLQPRSLATLRAWGALATLTAGGAVPVYRTVSADRDGRPLCVLDYRRLPAPDNLCLTDYYTGILDALTGALPGTVTYRTGARLTELHHDHRGRVHAVTATDDHGVHRVTTDLVLACDGHASKLRAMSGINVQMRPYPHRVAAFDLADVDLASDATTHVTGEGIRVTYPMPGRRARVYVQLGEHEFARWGRERAPQWLDEVVARTPALAPLRARLHESLDGMRLLSARRFLAPEWTRPGLALLGDAAHAVHPMAGQGMNAAIEDARVLGLELAAAGPGHRETDLALLRYERVRVEQMAFVSRFSHNMAALFTATGRRDHHAARYVLGRQRANPRLSYKVLYNMSGLGVLRFSRLDRLHQIGLPDPRANRLPQPEVS
ncbi:MAG TPA: NAD(P)/FAD-dependent oxidoreductase [Actinocrinis sp.]|nr:NAD(P)/FAD-dependent oxidoreductase [Actinocrinis sp.]